MSIKSHHNSSVPISSFHHPLSRRPWVDKYRPSHLNQVISNTNVIETLKKLVNDNRLPHLLLYGPPGTGKTSSVLAIANQLYGSAGSSFVLELNASDSRGIAVVREQIKRFTTSGHLSFQHKKIFKLVILDEADSMTKDAQTALRRIIENSAQHTRFCLICNYSSKIIPPIQSRCMKFRFAPLSDKEVGEKLQSIIESEDISLAPLSSDPMQHFPHISQFHPVIQALIMIGKGDMRRCITTLESASLALEQSEKQFLTSTDIFETTGTPLRSHVSAIYNALTDTKLSFTNTIKKINSIVSAHGYSLSDILEHFLDSTLSNKSLSSDQKAEILHYLGQSELRLAAATSEDIELSVLVGSFKKTLAMK